MTKLEEHLFGIPLSTHRSQDDFHQPFGEFPYELYIAAISVVFFRTTIPATKNEPVVLRWFFAILLAFLAYSDKSYELIAAVELFSYAVPICLLADWPVAPWKRIVQPPYYNLLRLALIAVSAVLSLGLSHLFATGELLRWVQWCTPVAVTDSFSSFLPIHEVQSAYHILSQFIAEPGRLDHQINRLFFVTFHVQCGIGYLGIAFLMEEQNRRNQLVRMDMTRGEEGDDDTSKAKGPNGVTENNNNTTTKEDRRIQKARKFQRTAGPFILYTAVPYMLKIIGYGNLNAFAFHCFKDDIHRAVRLEGLFEHDSHLVAVAEHSATSPEGKTMFLVGCTTVIAVVANPHINSQLLHSTWILLLEQRTIYSIVSYSVYPKSYFFPWS